MVCFRFYQHNTTLKIISPSHETIKWTNITTFPTIYALLQIKYHNINRINVYTHAIFRYKPDRKVSVLSVKQHIPFPSPPTPTCRQLINSSTTSQWTARLSTNGRCVYTVTSRLVGGVSPYMFGLLFAIHRNRDTLESNARKLVGQPLTHKRGYLLSHVYFLLYHQQRKEVEKTLCTIKSFFCVSLSFENYCD